MTTIDPQDSMRPSGTPGAIWDNPLGTDGFELVEYTAIDPADLIIFDEMGMRKFTATEAQDLCEII